MEKNYHTKLVKTIEYFYLLNITQNKILANGDFTEMELQRIKYYVKGCSDTLIIGQELIGY